MRAGYREWMGLAVLALPCMVVSMDATVLNLAIPELTADLLPSGSEQLWIVDSYAFLVAGLLMTMGMMGDRVGRRRMLLVGAAMFAAASSLGAFATSPGQLIASRIVLGAAGAMLAPSTLSLIRTMFADPDQRRVALGIWTGSFALGGLAGPLVGGLLLERFWWGSVFLVAVPVMLLLLGAGPFLLPEYRGAEARRVDITSAALSLAAVLAFVYGLKRIAENGLQPAYGAAVVLGVGAAVWFVRRQRRLTHPVVDLGLLRASSFSAPLLILGAIFFVLYGTQFITAQYLQLVAGLTPLTAGLLTLPGTVAYLVGSLAAPAVTRRLSTAQGMVGSLLIAAGGFGLLTQMGPDRLWVVVTGFVVLSIGLAGVYLISTDLTVSAAPSAQGGTTSALLETSANLGGALGIAGLGSTTLLAYRHAMPGSNPYDLPPDVWEAARRTIGGAAAAADRAPDAAGRQLLSAAHQAFTRGYRLAELVGTTLLLLTAAAAALALRNRRTG